MSTLTLTEFLLARIAEDEEAVNFRTRRMAPVGSELLEQFGDFGDDERWMIEIPAGRLLAECEAKRLAIDAAWGDHCRIEGEWGMSRSREQMSDEHDNPEVVEYLALPYADHPDYRSEWKP